MPVFAELPIRQERLQELNGERWNQRPRQSRTRSHEWVTFQKSLAASMLVLVVMFPYENPVPAG